MWFVFRSILFLSPFCQRVNLFCLSNAYKIFKGLFLENFSCFKRCLSYISDMMYEKFKDRMKPFEAVSVVGVSVSGGADSMALCDLTRRWCEEFAVHMRVFTFDHNLRTESAEEAQMVKRWCAGFEIEHATHVWKTPTKGNMLEAAREARLEALDIWREECDVVLVGHTKTDRAETVVMRLFRGSGVDGLSGMQPQRVVSTFRGRYTIVRPLIDASRHELRAHCQENGVPFCDDPSNDNDAYLRVKVRKLMRELEMDEDSLVATARRMRRAGCVLDEQVSRFWSDCVHLKKGQNGFVKFALVDFEKEMEETQMRLVRRAIKYVGKQEHPPRENAVKGVVCFLLAENSATLGGCIFKVKKGHVCVAREHRRG